MEPGHIGTHQETSPTVNKESNILPAVLLYVLLVTVPSATVRIRFLPQHMTDGTMTMAGIFYTPLQQMEEPLQQMEDE